MLAHSTMAETYLHTVLAEIVPISSRDSLPSTISGSTSALLQVAEGLEPPSAREGIGRALKHCVFGTILR